MTYSIHKKLFLTSIITTILSFLLIFICFNYITSQYIEKETTKTLTVAASKLQFGNGINFIGNIGVVSNELTDTIENTAKVVTGITKGDIIKTEISEGEISVRGIEINPNKYESFSLIGVDNLNKVKDTQNVDYIIMDENNKIIFPMDFIIGETLKSKLAEKNIDFQGEFYNEIEQDAIAKLANETIFMKPKKVSLNNSNYYLVEKRFDDGLRAIFYKNTQSLDDLVSDVNFVLFLLLLFFSILNVLLNMGFINGMVKSIRKLCDFATDIGNGNLEPKSLELKEKELIVLERDMNKMAQKLSEYDVEQKTFFQNVSHELRTPLMSIQGYAEGISSKVFKEDQIKDAANIIINESNRLATMVDELLYLSRMDYKEENEIKESLNLIVLIEDVISELGGIVNRININFEKDSNIFNICGNEDELKTAFRNILTNSLRYANSEVVIKSSSRQKSIEIHDDGPGVNEKDLPHIFKRFYKGDGGYTGIGLSIAESTIKGHKGSIKAWNENGAVFFITFSEN